MAVSDLTNTTWEIKNWPTISTSTDNTYSINFTANNISYTAFRLRNNGEYNYIYYNTTKVFDSDLGSWGDYSNYRTINITGGTDVTNVTLIAWLEANATQQATPTVTYDLTQLSLSTGTYTITVKAKATGYSDSVASNSVTYTVAPSGFTVSGTNDIPLWAAETAQYSTDNGVTWTNVPDGSFTLSAMTTFKLKIGGKADYLTSATSTQLGLNLPLLEDTIQTSNNYTLTQNITDLTIHGELD